eukprot:638998-Lingulodinium_polyedra.AAC.1
MSSRRLPSNRVCGRVVQAARGPSWRRAGVCGADGPLQPGSLGNGRQAHGAASGGVCFFAAPPEAEGDDP